LEKDEEVIEFLKDKWNFNLNYFDFGRVYKNGLMSTRMKLNVLYKPKPYW